jgi:transposase
MATTARISKEKRQSIITLKHEGQSIWNISRTFKVSSGAVEKPIKQYDENVSHEKGRPRVTSAAEHKFIRVTSLRNCTPNKCFTEFK